MDVSEKLSWPPKPSQHLSMRHKKSDDMIAAITHGTLRGWTDRQTSGEISLHMDGTISNMQKSAQLG